MPIPPVARAAAGMRLMTWSMLCVLALFGLPAGVWAQNVPAGLRACTTESDSARRLACYDREMALLSAPAAQSAPSAQREPPAQSGPPTRPGPSEQPRPSEQPGPSAQPAVAPASRAPTATAAAAAQPAAGAGSAAFADHHPSPWNIFHGGSSSNVTARVASLDRWPNAMVLHLDNGQIWEQIGRASGDLSLEAGDSVTIEKHLGAYWLSSRHVSDMQVRLKSQ